MYETLSKSNLYIYTESLDGYTFKARIEKYFCFKVKLISVDRNNSVDDRILLAWYIKL